MRLHEPGMETAGHHLGMREQFAEEADIGRDPLQPELPERPPELARSRREGLRSGRAVGSNDDLGDERVEARVRGVSRVAARVDPHPGSARRLEGLDDASGGANRPVRPQGFQVYPRLHREAVARDAVPPRRQWRAARKVELKPDEVDPRELLRNGVLDLDPGVRLDEIRGAGLVHEELEGREVREPRLPREGEGDRDDPLAESRIEVRGGCDLDDLLAPPLEAALALAEVHGPSGAVARHLDLDVPRPDDEALDVELFPAEGPPGLVAAAWPRALELRDAPGGGHPAAAPAPPPP